MDQGEEGPIVVVHHHDDDCRANSQREETAARRAPRDLDPAVLDRVLLLAPQRPAGAAACLGPNDGSACR